MKVKVLDFYKIDSEEYTENLKMISAFIKKWGKEDENLPKVLKTMDDLNHKLIETKYEIVSILTDQDESILLVIDYVADGSKYFVKDLIEDGDDTYVELEKVGEGDTNGNQQN